MRDIDLTYRDASGFITFGLKENSYNIDIEILLQKISTSFLSNNKTTYFGDIYGSEILNAGKYTIGDISNSDFKLAITSDILKLQNKIQADDVLFNTPTQYRLKNLSIQDIIYDKVTTKISLSVLVVTNSTVATLKLPVKI